MPERVHHRFGEASPIESVPNIKKRKRDDSKGPQQGFQSASTQPIKQIHSHQNIQNGVQSSTKQSNPRSSLPQSGPSPVPNVNDRNRKLGPSPMRERAKALWQARKTLPIWAHAAEVRKGLREKDVMLLVGETGSGKSTQVPQILASETWSRAQNVTVSGDSAQSTLQKNGNNLTNVTVGGCIAITEPRRVAAITLARRVAEEMGTPLGSSSPASTVGYSVRFDNSTSASTRIKFLTEGMLLQEMLRDPWLKAYSAVVVDEVHERGVNVDLVMGFMGQMVAGKNEGRGRIPLKVVVMSATAEMERLGNFFEKAFIPPKEVLNGFKPHGDQAQSEEETGSDESEWSGISSSAEDEGDVSAQTTGGEVKEPSNESELGEIPKTNGYKASDRNIVQEKRSYLPLSHVATCYIEGRQYPVTIKYTPEPVQDIVDAALRTIFQIHHKEPMPGDILVFLTGQETVESLESLVKEYAQGLGPDLPKLLVLPLFAALPQAAQQRVFQPAPPKTRKVIIATNIAETSVTVSGVRFVIDCGKAKIKHFRSSIGLDSLLVKPISRSAAIQRKGRAGREAPGQCYRLYTESDYLNLQQSNTPEILRCDLSHAILTMKARGVGDVINFPFLDHPPREALEKALLQLYQLGALTDTGDVSETGQQMAKLPLTVSLGRVLIAAAEPDLDCVLEVIDIISCLSVENLFLHLTSEEKKEEAQLTRRELYRREGDHLTLLTTVQAYAAEHSDRKAWAERHFVSHRAMQAVMDVRKQLRQQFKALLEKQGQQTTDLTPELAISVLKCFLKGFATNTARLFPDGSYKTIVGNQTVAIHPSSGLFGRKIEAIMYNESVFTNKSYARGVSAVQMDWIGEALGV